MSDEKSFSVCQEMLPLFRAVLKYIFRSIVEVCVYELPWLSLSVDTPAKSLVSARAGVNSGASNDVIMNFHD